MKRLAIDLSSSNLSDLGTLLPSLVSLDTNNDSSDWAEGGGRGEINVAAIRNC